MGGGTAAGDDDKACPCVSRLVEWMQKEREGETERELSACAHQ